MLQQCWSIDNSHTKASKLELFSAQLFSGHCYLAMQADKFYRQAMMTSPIHRPDLLQDTVLNQDWSSALYTAQGLMELQRLFGPIPTVRGIGAAAEAVADNLRRLIDTAEEESSALGSSLLCTWTA